LEKTPIKPIVWIIDSQQWPRAYLRAELIERGFDAVGFEDLEQALAALYGPHCPTPRMIVLELRGLSLKPEDLDTLARFGILTIALGGAVELNGELIKAFKWAAVIQRPFTIGSVADKVEELVGRAPS
jgi:hypothetical protein